MVLPVASRFSLRRLRPIERFIFKTLDGPTSPYLGEESGIKFELLL